MDRLAARHGNGRSAERVGGPLGPGRGRSWWVLGNTLRDRSGQEDGNPRRHPRATAPEAVASEFARQGFKAEVAEDVAQAVAKAQGKAGKRDLICATGSLFLVGEVIEHVKGLRPELHAQ